MVHIFHISLLSLAGLSLLCMLLGLLTALSYSDLVKSWRGGSVAVEVLGVSTRVDHRSMYTWTLACTPHKVIAWAMGWLYKVWMQGVRS